MSVTILEALENAEINIDNLSHPLLPIIKNQVHNARILLEKGYSPYTEVEPLLELYGDVESVPNK